MDKTTDTKASPIYRYRVVVKDGRATVERRQMKEQRSKYDVAPHLTTVRDWTSCDWPVAETEQGAIEAARAQQQRQFERCETRVREAEEARRVAMSRALILADLKAK